MWAIDNHTAYPAASSWVRDADGAEIWIIAVKVTYELLADGNTRVASQQIPITPGLVLHADGSPQHETDLGPSKTATDIWLSGHAWSQNGKPVSYLRVDFQVGPVERHIDVHGDRHWFLGALTSKPQPFTQMPLTWARAYDASDTTNPMAPRDKNGQTQKHSTPTQRHPHALPNLEPTGVLAKLRNNAASVGVGPIPAHWPARARYAGTYDAHWQATRAPLQAADLDPRHWQVSPAQQQVPGRLKGGEPITLGNLTPPGFAPSGLYRTRVPRLSLGFDTHFYDGSSIASHSAIHNLILLPDLPAICVVHHIALPCHAKVNQLDKTTIIEKIRPLDPSPGSRT